MINNFLWFVTIVVLWFVITTPLVKNYIYTQLGSYETGKLLFTIFGWVALGLLLTLTSAHFFLYV
jgi:hypothetical protein